MDSPLPEPAQRSKRATLVGVFLAALITTITLGAGVAIALRGGDDPDTLATRTEPATTTSAPATPSPVLSAPTAPSVPPTTAAPTTNVAPITTVADILAGQPTAPIAPPPDPRGYEDQIRLGGISIPKLGLEAPLFEGIRLTTLDNGPGHWPGTAMPGENGNVVVAAHRTSHGAAFRNIDQLVAGDLVQFSTAAGVFEYTVTGTQIVTPDAVWIVDQTENATATLFACHPPGSVSHRIVVNLELFE
ncbi:sortase [Ilumatobacter sp.]|uniref:sortase n=1 Tax=Ilumatobacter sp. TaxID=1967498 RepID=UPI0037517154